MTDKKDKKEKSKLIDKERLAKLMAIAASKKKIGKPRNYDLGNGVLRFSRSRMFHKKAVYKFLGKKTPKKVIPKKLTTSVKKIGGDKNGETRTVLLKKRRANYPTADPIQPRPPKKFFKDHKRHLKPNYVPGSILILLAGRHKGKRVVFLKQLKSGLLLVTGPFKLNGVPLRRVSQRYTIGTTMRVTLPHDYKVPSHINDEYFKRLRQKRAKKEEGDIFAKKKEVYKPSEQRKEDQKNIDKTVLTLIKYCKRGKLAMAYMGSMFGLRSSQYPHRMKF